MPAGTGQVGVWLIGARGGLATTVVAGAALMRRGLAPCRGLATERPEFQGLDLVPLANLVFGGHEIRGGTLMESAREISAANGSIPAPALDAIAADLEAAEHWIRPGTSFGCGRAVEKLKNAAGGSKDAEAALAVHTPRAWIQRIQTDLRLFHATAGVDRVVVVNLASTEPPFPPLAAHRSIAALDTWLSRPPRSAAGKPPKGLRASLLYAYAALDAGFPYVNFTPSPALVPALEQLAERCRVPFMGSDGKTGETLVKSALAPMFRHRSLRVLSWQGYNILGNRDGEVLADAEHLASKVRSKDGVLPAILGYPLHTHVGIDYVPSLEDLKTAWDFIHFEGFLGYRMSMQFIWQGCDSILAAPLVLDLARLADAAGRRGEWGAMRHLACYFKSPHGVAEQDLHAQWQALQAYAGKAGGGRSSTARS